VVYVVVVCGCEGVELGVFEFWILFECVEWVYFDVDVVVYV